MFLVQEDAVRAGMPFSCEAGVHGAMGLSITRVSAYAQVVVLALALVLEITSTRPPPALRLRLRGGGSGEEWEREGKGAVNAKMRRFQDVCGRGPSGGEYLTVLPSQRARQVCVMREGQGREGQRLLLLMLRLRLCVCGVCVCVCVCFCTLCVS
jgi:hypothetical protein